MIQANATTTDTIMWAIVRNLEIKYGSKAADREFSPLSWYVYSGRASTPFLTALVNSKPHMIAKILHSGGSDAEVIRRIKKHLRIPEE